jgi:alkanesulfonate monooxygenase SsuD/methylene tetrahydromethanopterin reductase-like flavin-dependent oxidoreductase (luciferase family)
MKVSYLCANTYFGAEAVNHPGWPTPQELYRPAEAARSYAINFDLARLADELGFDWVSTSEHHYSPRLLAPNAFVLSAALSQVVRRAKIAVLGPLVAMNNPVRIAEELALLDQISGGRCIVLFLRGTPNEFLSYGVNPDETRARTQEATTLIVRSLTEGRPFGWIGRYYRFRTVSVWPGSVQQPHPPFYYSGNSKESAAFAAAERLGMGISFYPVPFAAQLTEHYRQECARQGWHPTPEQLVYRCRIGVGEDKKEAEMLRAGLIATAETGGGLYAGRGGNVELPTAARPGMGLDEVRFCGDPDSVVRQIEDFYEATGMGVIDLIFSGFTSALTFEQTAKSMRLFASEVLPRIRHLGETAPQPKPVSALRVGAAQ